MNTNNERNIDWADVENKINIICCKFSNLSYCHEDLAQELRIHAWYRSDNYYDLYRKAIDFWRKKQSKESPDIPYCDLDVLGELYVDEDPLSQVEDIISLVRKELTRTPQNKWEGNRMELALRLFDIILADIDPKKCNEITEMNKSNLNHYVNKRLNLSWVAEETGEGYKQLVVAMKLLEDIIRGLATMHKIEIPPEYLEGYYDEK